MAWRGGPYLACSRCSDRLVLRSGMENRTGKEELIGSHGVAVAQLAAGEEA